MPGHALEGHLVTPNGIVPGRVEFGAVIHAVTPGEAPARFILPGFIDIRGEDGSLSRVPALAGELAARYLGGTLEQPPRDAVLNMPVLHSRQHFLKMQFPKTFRQLVELGIQHEYSMGYASQPGFRASICTPFPFYDVELEEEVPLMMHPFSVMEYTFTENLRLSPDESLEEMKKYIDVTRQFSGEMITVWHNRTFSEKDPAWKGWNHVYEEMIQEALR